MRILNYLLILILYTCSAAAQTATVTVTVKAPVLPADQYVYITGNQDAVGGWNPASVKLTRVDSTTWQILLPLHIGTTLEYKLTRGGWAAEALYQKVTLPGNFVLSVQKDTILTHTILGWRDDEGGAMYSSTVTGTLKSFSLPGKGVIPGRDIHVWLPPNYETDTEKRYPVLYMHDAQNVFDPRTSTLGVDWGLDEAADSLIRQNLINEIMVVGLNNTMQRRSEYGHKDTGSAYIDYLVTVAKPFVDSMFRTRPEREFTFTGGASMGGIISFRLAWERSDVFGGAACLSSAIKYFGNNYIDLIRNKPIPNPKPKLYIDNGFKGVDILLQDGNLEMLQFLKEAGFTEGTDFLWKFFPEDDHNESAWARRTPGYLIWFFGR